MKPLLAWAPQYAVCLQRSRLSPNHQSFSGGSMCLEILCLSASSFPKHLYVFVVLMNGTKVSGGPVEGGKSVKENSWSKAEVGSTEWSVTMSLTVRTEDSESDGDLTPQPLPYFLLPLTLPTSSESFSVDHRWPFLSFVSKACPLHFQVFWSQMPIVYACAHTHMNATLSQPSTQSLHQLKDNQIFSSVPVGAEISTCHHYSTCRPAEHITYQRYLQAAGMDL